MTSRLDLAPDLGTRRPAGVAVRGPRHARARRHGRLPAWAAAWAASHRRGLLVVGGLLLIAGVTHGRGMDGWPGRVNDDEGTYVAQAWAVQHWHTLAHYTYWYDHPPFGWIQIAAYTWATHAFERTATAVTAGREAMLWVKLASCALLYLLARRLRLGRPAAAAAVLLWSLSPLALAFQRMVFLDNLGVMWVLAALVLAASPRRSLLAVAGSAACLAAAILSKETAAVLLPAVALLLWQYRDQRTSSFSLPLFAAVLALLVVLYPLYAALKNELFEGPGHVSLLWAIKWQLFDRPPSGSLLDPHSDARALARSWLDTDPWLLGAGVSLTAVGLAVRRLRAVALALAIQVVMLCRNGYVPYAYVTAMLPFAALLVAGAADTAWNGNRNHHRHRHERRSPAGLPPNAAGRAAVVAALALGTIVVAPQWSHGISQAMTVDRSAPERDATAWATRHLPHDKLLLVDDNAWTDLVARGFRPYPIWFYKLDLDPAVRNSLRHGWRDIDYIMLGPLAPNTLHDLPLVNAALQHSRIVASFGNGEITIRQVLGHPPAQHEGGTPTGPDHAGGIRAAVTVGTVLRFSTD